MKSIKHHNFHLEFSSLLQLLSRFYAQTGGLDTVLTFCILDADVHRVPKHLLSYLATWFTHWDTRHWFPVPQNKSMFFHLCQIGFLFTPGNEFNRIRFRLSLMWSEKCFVNSRYKMFLLYSSETSWERFLRDIFHCKGICLGTKM